MICKRFQKKIPHVWIFVYTKACKLMLGYILFTELGAKKYPKRWEGGGVNNPLAHYNIDALYNSNCVNNPQ